MKKCGSLPFAAVILAVMFLLLHMQGLAQGLPEGIKAEVVAKYSSNIPGIDEIRLVKFTFQPGAVLKNFKVKDTGL
ncbi:MAG: hypothetical protein IIA40_11395 [SAR324 cluster bacterium]|nr:hypothetical protein [SAR324 cluster bacterium]